MPPAHRVKIRRKQRQITYYDEDLGQGINLRMIQIPGGEFLMGVPESEIDRWDDEGPQHQVAVPGFFTGKYPVTQAQWRAVTGLPEVEIELPTNPSYFKGNDRPVEQVSWHEVTEFCSRLAAHTGRPYRLPTEPEWEYACRAGTDTPFHFGKTITTDIANYRGTDNEELGWSGSYGDGPKGQHREETTPVGQFEVANHFGLYDLHGNVWEWCQDHWHDNYNHAPTDGSAWLSKDKEANRVLRGGSWYSDPMNCRSATRYVAHPSDRSNDIGFRVCCSPPALF